jgi:S-adenosylmethionine synthetase
MGQDTSFVQIVANDQVGVEELPYELVERKGVGHPDTMCDMIAERASSYYSRYCVEHFGRVAHHWFDKAMLFGGESVIAYGRGELTKPYTVLFAGKGAYAVGDQAIPLHDILHQAAADALVEVTSGFRADRHLNVRCEITDHQGAGRGSSRYRPATVDDLVEIGDKRLVSNDSNLLHGYAPYSRLENLVLHVEQFINGPEFKHEHADSGWDVKVIGSRRGQSFRLIVNMPFLASFINSLEHYYYRKRECEEIISDYAEQVVGTRPELLFNPTDRNGRPYLTALGSVADTGDVGVVGRGNRLNGLITPMRPMSIEAPAGKNPLDHTGKLYGVLAHVLADHISKTVGKSVEMHIMTSKEAPLDRPDEVMIRIRDWNCDPDEERIVRDIVVQAVSAIDEITTKLVFSGITMW